MKLYILFLLIMSTSISHSSLSQNLSDLLPGSPSGWNIQGEDKLYDPESLYNYIDGGAELYISYGMKEVISRLITNENGVEIRVEIFDMTEAKNAFGVFTHTRTVNEGIYGQGSQYFPGTQIFWKDKYYVSIMATDENEGIQSAISDLAKTINHKINAVGKIPQIVDLLPEENLAKDAYVYFHHYIWLNSYYYIADDNFLGIDKHSAAILAKYGEKESRYYLLIIKYADAEKASSAYAEYKSKFLNPQTAETAIQIEDESWLGGTVKDNYIVCVFNASTKPEIENLIRKAVNKIQ